MKLCKSISFTTITKLDLLSQIEISAICEEIIIYKKTANNKNGFRFLNETQYNFNPLETFITLYNWIKKCKLQNANLFHTSFHRFISSFNIII